MDITPAESELKPEFELAAVERQLLAISRVKRSASELEAEYFGGVMPQGPMTFFKDPCSCRTAIEDHEQCLEAWRSRQ